MDEREADISPAFHHLRIATIAGSTFEPFPVCRMTLDVDSEPMTNHVLSPLLRILISAFRTSAMDQHHVEPLFERIIVCGIKRRIYCFWVGPCSTPCNKDSIDIPPG